MTNRWSIVKDTRTCNTITGMSSESVVYRAVQVAFGNQMCSRLCHEPGIGYDLCSLLQHACIHQTTVFERNRATK
jgi:hypothetical protein